MTEISGVAVAGTEYWLMARRAGRRHAAVERVSTVAERFKAIPRHHRYRKNR